MTSRRFLITSALPYANGPLHFGHLAGVYIPADIYARHRKLQGHEALHICGSDEHGVTIMVAAEKAKMGYQEYVDQWHASHKNLFAKYGVAFDFFGRTSSDYHRDEVLRWFKTLHERGYVGKRTEKQLYCIDDKRFLPDRYVEGICYNCGYNPARGDECPNCGEWIDPIRLKNPVSKISGSRNIEVRDVEQYFLLLTKLEPEFRKWFATKRGWRPVVTGFVDSLLANGLIDRAITRDLDWGIDVPLPEAVGKKLYVWFDAPIGYVSNTIQCLKLRAQTEGKRSQDGEAFNDQAGRQPCREWEDWWHNKDVEISHFIGKDNIIFHALIWPSMILGTGFVEPPTELPANQFVNLEGKQFSKSSGWYVDAEQALDEFGADALRFYLCSLIPESGDSSFSWDAFASMQSEVGNKIGNFVHRSLTFIEKNWPEGLPASAFAGLESHAEYTRAREFHSKISGALDHFEFGRALSEVILLSQAANEYFHEQAPWKQIKENRSDAESTLAVAVFTIAVLGIILQPFVPAMSSAMLGHFTGILSEEDRAHAYLGDFKPIARALGKGYRSPVPAKVLLPRTDPLKIKACKEALSAKKA